MNEERAILPRRYQNWTGSVYFVDDAGNGAYRCYFHPKDKPEAKAQIGPLPNDYLTFELAQTALDQYAQGKGYEPLDCGDDPPEIKRGETDTTNEADEEPEETEPEELEETELAEGQPVSLLDDAFREIVAACDEKINSALRVMLESHQRKFEFTAKITFEQLSGMIGVTHETGYKFEPINYKSKTVLREPIQVVLGDDGNPIIPYDREHQMTFSEMEEAGSTVTSDASGVVESIQPDNAREECQTLDCPFYDLESESSCMLSDPDFHGSDRDVRDAVEFAGCRRPELIRLYTAIDTQKEETENE